MFSPDGYRALRQGAGVVRRGDRGVLAVTGADRLTWLQGLLTNDVLALPAGGICDAAWLTPQGRMITDMRVFNLPESTLLDVPGSLAEGLRARLDELLFSEDARVEDLSSTIVVVDLHGAASPAVVEHVSRELADVPLAADAAYGVSGFSFFVARDRADTLVEALRQAGAEETTLETLDVVRVEAGRPAFLIDMDDHTIPLEAGLEQRAISFTKGCYVGQEVIVRVVQRGQGRVARKLVGLKLSKAELPKAGAAILAADREVGHITSAVWSPTLESGIALGYVKRNVAQFGTDVLVQVGASVIPAEVSALPFVDNQLA